MYVTRARILYRSTLSGSLAGLCAWFSSLAIPFYATAKGAAALHLLEYIDASLVGLFLAVFCLYSSPDGDGRGNEDDSRGRKLRRALVGLVFGAALGVAAAASSIWMRGRLADAPPWTGVVLTWGITGLLVGILVGLVRYRLLFWHVALSSLGGLWGAVVGALLIASLGDRIPHWTHCLGLIVAGGSIGFASAYALGLARGAILTLKAPNGPRSFGLLRGTRVQFGSGASGDPGFRFVPLAADMADVHGGVVWRDGDFYAVPHASICGWDGRPLLPFLAGHPPIPVNRPHKLRHNDEIQMGQCLFQFTLRSLVALLLTGMAGGIARAQPGAAQSLVRAELPVLLRARPGSDLPLFRLSFNLHNPDGSTASFPVFSSEDETRSVEISEGSRHLPVCSVAVGALPRRYTLVLLDVSGSMLERLPDGRTKFEVMIEAAQRLGDQFIKNEDYIAVVPFASRGVVNGVQSAPFLDSRESFLNSIRAIPAPLGSSNTGLFTATRAGGERLLAMKHQYRASGQYLMVIMTDGINDVHPGDDAGLETTVGPVAAFLASTSIPVITVGFGDAPEMETDLKVLAQPGPTNYHPAPDPDALAAAFRDARASFVDRLRITFLPGEESFTQMVRRRQFEIRIRLATGGVVVDREDWTPPPVVAPEDVAAPEEFPDRADAVQSWWSSPWFILVVLGSLHLFFGLTVQKLIWGRQDTAELLLAKLRTPGGR